MARDILSEYGPDSPMDQKPRATKGGVTMSGKRDVMGYQPPYGPSNIKDGNGPGLHGTNWGNAGTQGKSNYPVAQVKTIVGLGGDDPTCGTNRKGQALAAPTFVNNGTHVEVASTSVTPALPGSRVNGNLLIAFCRNSGSSTGVLSVSAGWNIFASVKNGGGVSHAAVAAYAYVTGSEAAPVFSFSGSSTFIDAVVCQYTGVVSSSPIGALSTNFGDAGPPITCGSITMQRPSSLAISWNGANTGPPATPSGFTLETNSATTSFTISDLTGVAQGGTAGPTSVSTSVSNWGAFLFELASVAASAKWAPFQIKAS